jgi:5-dehydro-4-deoxyglucarate dehydratase
MAADFSSLKKQLGSGLLAFPATPFKEDLTFDEANYRQSIAFNIDNGAVGLFAPGGTGEFFSVTLAECARITRTAVEVAKGKVPIIAGVGYGTMMAVEFAKAAEAAGAQGVLVLPPYLLNVEQAGLEAHIDAICRAVGIGVIPTTATTASMRPTRSPGWPTGMPTWSVSRTVTATSSSWCAYARPWATASC